MSEPLQPSRDAANDYLAQIGRALYATHRGDKVSSGSRVWPDGLDRAVLHRLPISVRTRNCLSRARLMAGDSGLTAVDLLRLPNFGRTSLKDLLCNVEKFLLDSAGRADARPSSPPRRPEGASTMGIGSAGGPARTKVELSSWNRAGESLRPLLAASADLLGTRTLADALHPDILCLASRMNLAPALEAISVSEIVERVPSLSMLVATRVQRLLEAASERQRAIIQERLLRAQSATLEEVGLQFGVTRERIRQMQDEFERKFDKALGEELGIIAATLKAKLGPMVSEDDLERRIEAVVPYKSPMVYGLFRKSLINVMGFTVNDGIYMDDRATEILQGLRAGARSHADDVGLLHEQQLIDMLPDVEWEQYWPWLRERSGLHGYSNTLALRDTAKARVKAALMAIGRPATREEIASVCGFDDARLVGATLSNITSVVRADKERWGLQEWIGDEYGGILGEILRRIEEGGGATTTERLLTELPSKFNVSPASVRAYMQTSRFEICDGSISLANPEAIRLRHLDDVIHGRDSNGAPYWTFVVENRYFEGHSVVGVPPEFASALGCSPDCKKQVQIVNLPNYRGLSLSWRLASTAGASIGYLSEPLRQLGLQPGDRARVTIRGLCSAELNAHGASAQPDRSGGANAILDRILRRRRSLP